MVVRELGGVPSEYFLSYCLGGSCSAGRQRRKDAYQITWSRPDGIALRIGALGCREPLARLNDGNVIKPRFVLSNERTSLDNAGQPAHLRVQKRTNRPVAFFRYAAPHHEQQFGHWPLWPGRGTVGQGCNPRAGESPVRADAGENALGPL